MGENICKSHIGEHVHLVGACEACVCVSVQLCVLLRCFQVWFPFIGDPFR